VEEALQALWDDGKIVLPVVRVDFSTIALSRAEQN